jgi:hypothetical protein
MKMGERRRNGSAVGSGQAKMRYIRAEEMAIGTRGVGKASAHYSG